MFTKLLLVLTLAFSAKVACAQGPRNPVVDPIDESTREITGYTTVIGGAVQIRINGKAGVPDQATLEAETGRFKYTLPATLNIGDRVQAIHTVAGTSPLSSAEVIVAKSRLPVPVIIGELHEGDDKVTVSIEEAIESGLAVRVRVRNEDNTNLEEAVAVRRENTQQFMATLNDRLRVGETVVAFATSGKTIGNPSTLSSVRTVIFDWGRVRAVATAGTVLTKSQDLSTDNEFLPAKGYFGINFDTNWGRCIGTDKNQAWLTAKDRKDKLEDEIGKLENSQAEASLDLLAKIAQRQSELAALTSVIPRNETAIKQKQEEIATLTALLAKVEENAQKTKLLATVKFPTCTTLAFLVNTSFEARMGATATVAVTTTGTTPGQTVSTGVTTSGKLAGFNRDLGVVQSTFFQGAIYIPIFSPKYMQWQFHGENAVFVAPLFKMGYQTTAQAVPVGNLFIQSRDLYSFHVGGFRLGHLSFDHSTNVAPEIISYLDITWTWDRLPFSADNNLSHHVFPRYAFEGRLKVPGMPLITGVDLSRSKSGQGVPDELRFIFATRFDIGKLFSKLLLPTL